MPRNRLAARLRPAAKPLQPAVSSRPAVAAIVITACWPDFSPAIRTAAAPSPRAASRPAAKPRRLAAKPLRPAVSSPLAANRPAARPRAAAATVTTACSLTCSSGCTRGAAASLRAVSALATRAAAVAAPSADRPLRLALRMPLRCPRPRCPTPPLRSNVSGPSCRPAPASSVATNLLLPSVGES